MQLGKWVGLLALVVSIYLLWKIRQVLLLLFQLQRRLGDFVIEGSPLVFVYPTESGIKKLVKQVNDAFVLGSQCINQQDVEFSINQLGEIAVRALSPGINELFTAIRCIDQLSAAICHLVQKEISSAYRYDDQGQLRVFAAPVTFEDVTDAAFKQIRQYGQTSVAVTIRLLEVIAVITPFTHTKADQATLLRHANIIEHDSQEGITKELDLQDIQERYLVP